MAEFCYPRLDQTPQNSPYPNNFSEVTEVDAFLLILDLPILFGFLSLDSNLQPIDQFPEKLNDSPFLTPTCIPAMLFIIYKTEDLL